MIMMMWGFVVMMCWIIWSRLIVPIVPAFIWISAIMWWRSSERRRWGPSKRWWWWSPENWWSILSMRTSKWFSAEQTESRFKICTVLFTFSFFYRCGNGYWSISCFISYNWIWQYHVFFIFVVVWKYQSSLCCSSETLASKIWLNIQNNEIVK